MELQSISMPDEDGALLQGGHRHLEVLVRRDKYDDNDDDDGDGDDDDGIDRHLKVLVRRDSKPLRRVEELIL